MSDALSLRGRCHSSASGLADLGLPEDHALAADDSGRVLGIE